MIKLSSFGIRTMIAFIFGPLIILAALKGHGYFLGFVVIVVGVGLYELFGLEEAKGYKPQKLPGLVGGLGVVLVFYFGNETTTYAYLVGLFLVFYIVELFRNIPAPMANVATTILSVFYAAVLFGHMLLIRELPATIHVEYNHAGRWLMMMIFSVWICDTAAYLIGSAIGKHKLMKRVSPNKTIEGTVAGFIFAIITAWLCHNWFIQGISLINSLVIGTICGSISQIGDLIESLFKRDAGVKDSSRLIPGHGGMLDRFDSLTFVAPVVFLYLRYVVF